MFSHALILYQNTLVTFWEKTAKTMNHVNNGFKVTSLYLFLFMITTYFNLGTVQRRPEPMFPAL